MSRMVCDHIGGATDAKTTFIHLNLQACSSSMIFHELEDMYENVFRHFFQKVLYQNYGWAENGGNRHELGRQHFGERREEKEKGEVASLSGWRYVTG